jgi:DNA-binding winged helix-turn-helix (wHTH) protein
LNRVLYSFDDFELDAEDFELRRSGALLKVDPIVLRLLSALVRNAGRLVSKEELIEVVWEGRAVADNAITVSMARLRKALGESGGNERITTVYGRGYRFVQPVAALVKTAMAAAPASVPPATHEPPFVGRERVLQRLLEALGEARGGHGRACLLLGEPGIGKTRVVEQLERAAQSAGVSVAWGYCREAGDTPPLWPWLRLLREVTAGAWRNDTACNTAERHELFEAMARELTAAAEQTPWLLVLEDLHRADAASLELLSHLLDEIARTRILVVATVRHTRPRAPLLPETHLPRILGHRNSERIALERLQPLDVAAYVDALLDDPDGSLSRAVFDKSEGNPFFMAELARGLCSAEQPSSKSLEVPDTALELLRQRVAKLDPQARAVLEAAAVIGRSFELPLLAMILERDPSALMLAIDQAIADEIVIAAPGSLTAFAFGHELQRAVLYDALSPRDQRALHLRVADALGHRFAQGESIPASELAYHSHAALPDGDLRTTVQRCRAAANAAAVVFAIPDVVRYARQALEALDLIPGASVRLRMSLLYQIAAFSRGHSWPEVERSTQELTRIAREHGDGPMLALASAMLNIHPELKPLPGASEAAEHALQLLPTHQLGLRAIAMAQLAISVPRCYSRDESSPLIEQAVALAQKSDDRLALDGTLIWRMHLEGGPDHGHAEAICEELDRLTLLGTRDMPVMPVVLALFRGTVALQRGDVAAVPASLFRAESLAQHLNHYELLWHVKRCQTVLSMNQGALAEGRTRLTQLHQEALQSGIRSAEPLSAFDRAVLLGRTSAEHAQDGSLARALEHDVWDPPSLWALKIRALATAGRMDEARASLRTRRPSTLAALPCDSQYLGTLGHLARAALVLDATDYFEPLYALLARYPRYFSAQLSFWCEGAVPALLGRLSLALGRPAEAIAHLEVGLAAERRAGLIACASETQRLLEDVQREQPARASRAPRIS